MEEGKGSMGAPALAKPHIYCQGKACSSCDFQGRNVEPSVAAPYSQKPEQSPPKYGRGKSNLDPHKTGLTTYLAFHAQELTRVRIESRTMPFNMFHWF